MNIFILEDNILQQTRIEEEIGRILMEHRWPTKHFEVYGKPNQLLEDISELGNHQIFFLDIEIKDDEKKGLDIAREIRKRDPNAVIVFVTTHSEFMPVSFQYQVSALDFIDKELSDDMFRKRLKQALSYVHENQGKTLAEDSFVFKGPKAQVQVPFSDLLYIETSTMPHKLILYSTRERVEFYGQLSDILAQDSRLYHCHRSFIVNPYNISSIDKEERIAYLKNGYTCMISRLKVRSLMRVVEKLHEKGE